MCTVTFIPSNSGFFLTSSRDEQNTRPTLPPKKHIINDQELYFPKDEVAGGTWISVSKQNRAACLLNGAFKKHERKEKYAKSRGIILLESFNYKNINTFVEEINLTGVEPFTLLLIDYNSPSLIEFIELRWDEKEKHIKMLNTLTPQIWSSATLYNSDAIQKRKLVFDQWVKKHPSPTSTDIQKFHNQKHGLQSSIAFLMKRDNNLMTLSISQIIFEKESVRLNYLDVIENKSSLLKI